MDFYVRLNQKFKNSKEFEPYEKINIDKQNFSLPELDQDFDKISAINCMEFVDGIETDSVAFKYFNSLNQFRY